MSVVVTFDCWQTLIEAEDREVSRGIRIRALHETVRGVGRVVSEDQVATAFDAACERQFLAWWGGEHAGAAEVTCWTLDAVGVGASDQNAVAEGLVSRIEDAALHDRVRALPRSAETLAAVREAGARTALVCDTGLAPGRVVRELLARCGLAPLLEALVFSDEVGVAKPHRRMFEVALGAVGAPPERATHVGDLRHTDVAGARAAGMRTVRLRAAHDDTSSLPDADQVADDHGHLQELLARGILGGR